MSKIELTERQEEALRVFADMDGRPSLVEWSEAMGVSYFQITRYLRKLKSAGLLATTPGMARSTRLTDAGKRYLKRRAK